MTSSAAPASSPLREALAAVEHEQWAHWTRYMLDTLRNTGIPMTSEIVARWERQIATPYAELTEAEKNSDREWADKVLAVLSDKTGITIENLERVAAQADEDRHFIHAMQDAFGESRGWIEQMKAEMEALQAAVSPHPPMRIIHGGNLPPEREGVWPDEAIDAMVKSMVEVEDERILMDTLAWVDAQNLSSDFLKYDPSLPVRLVAQTPNGVTESVWVDAENPDRIVGIPTPDAMRLIREDEDRQLSLPFGDGR